MKKPSKKKELQLLLSKVNCYNQLFKKREEALAPLYECNSRDEFIWDATCDQAFEAIKHVLKQSVVNYDPNVPIILTYNASPLSLAAYLSHPSKNGVKPFRLVKTSYI